MIERNKDVKFLSKSQALDNNFLLETLQDVCLNKKRSNFNLYRYNIEYVNSIYTFQIKGIEADYDEFTVGLFDFKENKIIQYFLFSTVEDISFSFITGDDVEGIALCIYAGVFRATKNISCNKMSASLCRLRRCESFEKASFRNEVMPMLSINCPIGNRPQLDDKSPPLKSTLQKDLKERVVFAKLDMRAPPLLIVEFWHLQF